MSFSMFHKLGVRVSLGTIVLILVLFGSYSFLTVRFYNDQMMQRVTESATRISDIIRQSTHYSMLLNRREDVYAIINTIGAEQGVEGIRIYNKRGEIIYSTNRSEQGTAVDLKAEACYACHEQARPLESLPTGNRARIYASQNGHRVLGLIDPIRNEPSCSDAACHAHPSDRKVLGVLDVRMSLASVDAAIDGASRRSALLTVIGAAIAALLVSWLLAAGVLRPVHRIAEGTHRVTEGDLDHVITLASSTELGDLATAFNRMTASLKREEEKNDEWSRTLQQRIDEKTAELRSAQEQMIHVEKMASLGRLSATVAHELNNPLEAILTYAKLIGRRLTKGVPDAESVRRSSEEVATIARETERCGAIVKSLLLFSKKQVGEYAFVPVRQMIERALRLVEHHCTISDVTVEAPLPPSELTLMCNEGQIEQALLALFVNAVEAMPGGGTLRVGVTAEAEEAPITVTVADTGSGIAAEDLPHIFEPFFTTKHDGKGVGLGLAVVYGIVEHHGGSISVKSTRGKGTEFTLRFPRTGVTDEHPRGATLHEAAS